MTLTLKCPVCDHPLLPAPRGWQCESGHSFDRAKRGYTNLLLAQHRRSKAPGDDKAMVQARSRFLERGRYQPLMDTLLRKAGSTPEHWLDIGCGEGWYTAQLAEALGPEAVALDISKPAVDAAAKRRKDLCWLVASGARLPLFDASVDTVFVLFTRVFSDDIARVLKPGGRLMVVGTAEDHLLPLRKTLYESVRQSRFDARRFLDERFTFIDEEECRLQWQPQDLEELQDLLAMTPHYWRASPQAKVRLPELLGERMPGHFVIQQWQRRTD